MFSLPLLPSRPPRSLALVAGLLLCALVAGPSPALAAPVAVRLLTSPVPLTEEGAELQVVVRDRRPSDEGGADPELLGRFPLTRDGQEIRTEGPDPSFAIPSLVLDELREAGFAASSEPTQGALLLEVALHRFWVSGVDRPTAGIDVVLGMRAPSGGRALRRQRIEVWGSSTEGSPEGPRAAVSQALDELRRELRVIFDSRAFEASVLVDGAPEPEYRSPTHARQPGYAMRRRIGFGGATRAGVESIPQRSITEPQAEFLTLELRLVAGDYFSFDWLVDFIGPLATAAAEGGRYPLEFKTTLLAHFSIATSRRTAVAVAPGMHIHAIPYDLGDPEDSDAIIYFAFRLGVDLSTPGREFGFGIYLRPQIGAAVDRPGDGTRVEVYAEIAWTLFAGRWERLRR